MFTLFPSFHKSLSVEDIIRASELEENEDLVRVLKSWTILKFDGEKEQSIECSFSPISRTQIHKEIPKFYSKDKLKFDTIVSENSSDDTKSIKNQAIILSANAKLVNNNSANNQVTASSPKKEKAKKKKAKSKVIEKTAALAEPVAVQPVEAGLNPNAKFLRVSAESEELDFKLKQDMNIVALGSRGSASAPIPLSWSMPRFNSNPMTGIRTPFKIYVDNLPLSVDSEDLRQAFESFGEVTHVDISFERLKDRQLEEEQIARLIFLKKAAGKNISSIASAHTRQADPFHVPSKPKNASAIRLIEAEAHSPVYAFLYFKSEESLSKVLAPYMKLFGMVIEGRACRVYEAREKCTLWISKVKVQLTAEEMRVELKKMILHELRSRSKNGDKGADPLLSVNLSTASISFSKDPHFYSVEFENHEQALLAHTVMLKYKNAISPPPNSPAESKPLLFEYDENVIQSSELNIAGVPPVYAGGIGGRAFRVDWIPPGPPKVKYAAKPPQLAQKQNVVL